jgi:hypothetical protein
LLCISFFDECDELIIWQKGTSIGSWPEVAKKNPRPKIMQALQPGGDVVTRRRYDTRRNASTNYDGNIPPRFVLSDIFDDEGEAIKFMITEGVIDAGYCPFCGGPSYWKCMWSNDTRVLPSSSSLTLRCCKNRDHVWSPFRGTAFTNCRKPANVILELIYCWSNRETQARVSRRMHLSRHTVRQYYKMFREVCMADELVLSSSLKLGGPGIIVEMDESKFGKRKYNRGHRVDGNWVWGCVERIVDRNTGKCTAGKSVMVVVPRRNIETLMPLILRFILPGTYIISDMYSSYYWIRNYSSPRTVLTDAEYRSYFGYLNDSRPNPFRDHYYKHDMVNHSQTYKDPVTGAHTNTIEGQWRCVKDKIPNRVYSDRRILQEYLYEHAWEMRRKPSGRFYGMIDSLRHVRITDGGRLVVQSQSAGDVAGPTRANGAVLHLAARSPRGNGQSTAQASYENA